MAKSRYRFNRVSVAAMSELHNLVADSLGTSQPDGRPSAPSWETIASRPDKGGRRILLRCHSDGGLAWLHIDDNDRPYESTRIADDEARKIWIEFILQFSTKETERLQGKLQPGIKLEDALESALGFTKTARSIYLRDQPSEDGTTLRRCLVRDRGIVAAWVDGDNRILRSELITGKEAWASIKHFTDP